MHHQENSSSLICSSCQPQASFEKYLSHTTEGHLNRFSCPVEHCFRTYYTKYSLKYHFNHSHQIIIPTVENQIQEENLSEQTNNIFDINSENSMLNTVKICFNSTVLNQNSIDSDFVNPETVKGSTKSSSGDNNYFSHIEQFIDQMYDFPSMPRSLIQNLLKIVDSLFSNVFSDILNLFNNEELTLANLKNELTLIHSKIKDAFINLYSEYKRIQHYEKTKFYVKPVVEVASTILKEKKFQFK